MRIRAPVAALAALIACAFSAAARADVDVRLEMGHGGAWIEDVGTPVFVELRNASRDPVVVAIALSDSDRFSGGTYRQLRSVALGPGAARREVFLVPGPSAFSSPLGVDLETEPRTTIHAGGQAFTRGIANVPVTDEMSAGGRMALAGRVVGVLAEGGARAFAEPLRRGTGVFATNDEVDTVEVLSVDPAILPYAALALTGIDALLVVAPPVGFGTDARAREGLLDWVALGGRLVFASPEDLTALSRGPLGALLPADATAIARGGYGGFLTAHTNSLHEDFRPKRPPAAAAGPLARLVPREGGEAKGVPLNGGLSRVERAFGQGSVVVLAYDVRPALTAADVREGQYAERIAGEICGRPSPLEDEAVRERAEAFGLSYDLEVDDQVQKALSFGAFAEPPLFLVLAALLLYVVAVGPLDYLVLKRLGKQRLTTLTFAGSVLVFTALAYGASFLVFAEGAVVNRMVFIDYADVPGEARTLARAHDVVGFYSPVSSETELRFPLPAVIGSSGLPGAVSTGDVGRSLPISITGGVPTEPHGVVEVAFRSQRNVCTQMAGPVGRTVDVRVTRTPGGGLEAEVTNGLPVAIEGVHIVRPRGEGSFDLGAFGAGETRVVALRERARSPGDDWTPSPQGGDETAFRELAALLSRLGPEGLDGRPPRRNSSAPVIASSRTVQLAKAGIGHGSALAAGRGLLIGFAAHAPFPLPADDAAGRAVVVIRKEVDLP